MASVSQLCSILLTLLLSLCVEATMGRRLISVATKEGEEEDGHLLTSLNKVKDDETDDPSLYMYFTIDDLKTTKELPIYFYRNDLRTLPPLLSKEEADVIPFSRRNLQFLLDYFSIPRDSPQGRAMKETLGHCDAKPIEGEVKFCATSLESMVDLVRETLGYDVGFRVLTTRVLASPASGDASYTLRNYTFAEAPRELAGVRMLGCHRMPYPYVVYYCHGHRGGSRVFEVSLVADRGRQRVVGPAVCHMDTSTWDEDHVAFKVLKMRPRSGPVCHFFPLDNIVWVTM